MTIDAPRTPEGVTSSFLIGFTFLHRNPSIIHYSTKAILQLTQGNGYSPKTMKIIVQRKAKESRQKQQWRVASKQTINVREMTEVRKEKRKEQQGKGKQEEDKTEGRCLAVVE
jgi:hypothetical protein